MKIKVLIKKPGEQLRASEVENTLEALQSVVGGVHRDGNGSDRPGNHLQRRGYSEGAAI